MNKEIIENITKVSFLNDKLRTVENLINQKNYKEAYKATAALIEIVCMICLQKIHHEMIEHSDIVVLASILGKHHEKEMKELLIEINGEYQSINLRRNRRIRHIRIIR